MKHLKPVFLSLIIQIAILSIAHAQSPVGKNLHEIIGLFGSNFARLTDAQGMHVLQYKRLVAKDTISDFIYLQGFTCVKEVSIRPASDRNRYIDSLSKNFTSAGYNSWRDKDSTFITVAERDGFLDITSFSASYYNKIAH